MIYMYLSNNPSSGEINSSNLSCFNFFSISVLEGGTMVLIVTVPSHSSSLTLHYLILAFFLFCSVKALSHKEEHNVAAVY